LAGKPDKNISLGRPRCRWEYNIKLSLPEVGWGAWNVRLWVVIRDRWWSLVNAAMNSQVP